MSTGITSVTKEYRDISFAHRQHVGGGKCSRIHGHSWRFAFTFGGPVDSCGFIVDFGKLRWLSAEIDRLFDHACAFNESDPMLPFLQEEFKDAFKFLVLPSVSCEGIAAWLHSHVSPMLAEKCPGVRLLAVEVAEDDRNSARFVAISYATAE